VEEGRLILAPVKRKRYSLKELVDQITPENLPGETLWGPSVGNEIW
jgi:antitoxin MazE